MSDSAKDQRKRPASDIPEPKGFKAKIRKLVRRAARPKPKPAPNAENPADPSPARQRPKAKEDGCGCLVIGVLLTAVLVWLAWNKFFL